MNTNTNNNKIVQIGATYKIGGPGWTTHYVHNYLQNEGFESYVICCSASDIKDDNNIYIVENRFGNIIRRILVRLFGNNDLFYIINTLKVISILKRITPDVIHLRIIHNRFNFKILFRYLCKIQKPVVITLHDMWFLTGGCFHFYSFNCEAYKKTCSNCPVNNYKLIDCSINQINKRRVVKEKYINKLQKVHFIAVSSWVKQECEESFISKFPIKVIHNALDNMQVKNDYSNSIIEAYKKSGKKIILGVASYWSDKKGVYDFIRLSEMLAEGYQIILVGSYSETIHNDGKIYFLGRIEDRNEMASIFNIADVFVHLSKEETFGKVIVEAACGGLKVIGYDSTAIGEIVRLSFGEVISEGNIKAVCQKITEICNNNIFLSKNEVMHVKETFSLEKMKQKHTQLYKLLV